MFHWDSESELPQRFRLTFSTKAVILAIQLAALIEVLQGCALMALVPPEYKIWRIWGFIMCIAGGITIKLDLPRLALKYFIRDCADDPEETTVIKHHIHIVRLRKLPLKRVSRKKHK